MTDKGDRHEPTPAQRLAVLEREYRSLQSEVQLSDAKGRLEDLQTQVNGTLNSVRVIRQKGYQYEPDLEDRSVELQEQWAELRPGLIKEIEAQQAQLAKSMKAIDVQMRAARSSGTTQASAFVRLEQGLGDIEAQIQAAESTIRGMYGGFSSRLSQHRSHLTQLEWMLNEAAESTFSWFPTEAILRAVQANWIRNQGDEPRGVLFLTDQRLLFERKEELATKKVLFVTTEKKKVHEPLLELTLASVENVKSENKGLMGHEDHIFLDCGSSAPVTHVHFHLDGQDCDLWMRTIRRAQAGEFDAQRIEPISEQEQERLRNAPSKCGNCGAAVSAPLLRGQRQITCAYCGGVMRV